LTLSRRNIGNPRQNSRDFLALFRKKAYSQRLKNEPFEWRLSGVVVVDVTPVYHSYFRTARDPIGIVASSPRNRVCTAWDARSPGVCGAVNTRVCVRPNISEAKLRPLTTVASSGVWYAIDRYNNGTSLRGPCFKVLQYYQPQPVKCHLSRVYLENVATSPSTISRFVSFQVSAVPTQSRYFHGDHGC
jgi:hypothetical protein